MWGGSQGCPVMRELVFVRDGWGPRGEVRTPGVHSKAVTSVPHLPDPICFHPNQTSSFYPHLVLPHLPCAPTTCPPSDSTPPTPPRLTSWTLSDTQAPSSSSSWPDSQMRGLLQGRPSDLGLQPPSSPRWAWCPVPGVRRALCWEVSSPHRRSEAWEAAHTGLTTAQLLAHAHPSAPGPGDSVRLGGEVGVTDLCHTWSCPGSWLSIGGSQERPLLGAPTSAPVGAEATWGSLVLVTLVLVCIFPGC